MDLTDLGKAFDNVTAILKEFYDGRNADCWDICSFGGKHADLDAGGCTGIGNLIDLDEHGVTLSVGGHKTVGCPSVEPVWDAPEDVLESYGDVAQEIVNDMSMGYDGYWSGDDWSLSFSDRITVEWMLNDDGEVDLNGMAQQVYAQGIRACARFSKDMGELSKAIDGLYRELDENYPTD